MHTWELKEKRSDDSSSKFARLKQLSVHVSQVLHSLLKSSFDHFIIRCLNPVSFMLPRASFVVVVLGKGVKGS